MSILKKRILELDRITHIKVHFKLTGLFLPILILQVAIHATIVVIVIIADICRLSKRLINLHSTQLFSNHEQIFVILMYAACGFLL